MRSLLALALVLISSAALYLWRKKGGILAGIGVAVGINYALRLPSVTIAGIVVAYFLIELAKSLKRG